jgi:trans-2,3-dihydro-3-hydroxyanthranilate isomerase
MNSYRFLQVDVFSDRPFGGNPLAVFPDAEGLTTQQMQQLALELNLSEITFVLPPTVPGADFRVRIFTPAKEIPFAGHPVIGTHWVLARLGRVDLQEPVTTVRFELGVGVLPADLHVVNGHVERVVMTQDRPRFGPTLDDTSELAMALGLDPTAISETKLPAQPVSTGLSQLIVPVQSLADVEKMKPTHLNVPALDALCRSIGAEETALVFSLETVNAAADVHVRFFAPSYGIPEDPATGSGNGALAAYLVKHNAVPVTEPTTYLISEQGIEIGRPSTLYLEIDSSGGDPSVVRVGGQVAPVIEGTARF